MALLGITWCPLRTFRTSGTDEKHDEAAEIGRVLAARRPKKLLHRPETCNCSPTLLQNEGQPSGKCEKVE